MKNQKLNFLQNVRRKSRRFSAKSLTILALITLLMFTLSQGKANNLVISNVTPSQTTLGNGTVTFDISWDNSWRTNAPPNNWDAAWVFVKFRDCSAGDVQFTHGALSTTGNTFGGSLEASKKDGTAGFDADLLGVMLRNSASTFSGSESGTITLKVTNLPAAGVSLDVRVFGIEMVFVPQGGYTVGDGNGTTYSYYSLEANNYNSNIAVNINSEAGITVYDHLAMCSSSGCALLAGYPKGYNAFYVMKYEISQGQYADFLNATFSAAQSARFYSTTSNRYTITNTGAPLFYVAGRPDRACNYLGWADVSAYLDWAALRPLTEMEWEKAARGPSSNPLELAWGNNTAVVATDISGAENGAETITTAYANIAAGSVTYTGMGSDLSTGPLRVGIFATASTTTRQQTGAGYFGTMEMSGNVSEFCISVYAGKTGQVSASGVSLGDGVIDNTTGNHNVTSWPAAAPATSQTIINKGGAWSTSTSGCSSSNQNSCEIAISNRYRYGDAARYSYTGGRGGR